MVEDMTEYYWSLLEFSITIVEKITLITMSEIREKNQQFLKSCFLQSIQQQGLEGKKFPSIVAHLLLVLTLVGLSIS